MAKIRPAWDYFFIIAWNIYVGTGVGAARSTLRAFIKSKNPHVIALMEATNLFGDLEGMGYKVIQLKASPKRPGNIPNDANIALLVRDDLKIVKSFIHRMTEFWRGPKHGFAQDPRVYRSVKVKFAGRKIRILCAHTPFGTYARAESANFLVRWLKRGGARTVDILVLDGNMSRTEFNETVVFPAEADGAANDGVEMIAWENCALDAKKNLGKGPSDHPAMLYTMRVKTKEKAA